jgi:prepilin-type N-terminal cleavage/methylation domain-containing protein
MGVRGGFTILEVVIVLLIVGTLLAGFLRAQEMVTSARVKNLANDFHTIPAYLQQYQDRFRALPGDDPAADTHFAGAMKASTPAAGQGNGSIDAAWNSSAATDESRLVWQHLRLARLLDGPTDPADERYTPRNSLGGPIGLSSVSPALLQIAGMMGSFQLCSAAIPGRMARELDTLLDDGNTATGSVRVVADGSGLLAMAVATPLVNDTRLYTVCMTF